MNVIKRKGINHWHQISFFLVYVLLIKVMIIDCYVIPECPSPEGNSSTTSKSSFCQCNLQRVPSGAQISISCNFNNQEDVVLTEDIYPFQRSNLILARVVVRNASSVKVTEGFLGGLQSAPSAVLDVWRGGQVTFESSPFVPRSFPVIFKTYLGIGIIKCRVPSIPKYIFRDRHVGGLLIKGSQVEVISRDIMYNVNDIKYLKIIESTIGSIEGPLTSGKAVPLKPNKGSDDMWQGLTIAKSSIGKIAPGAFFFTNKEDLTASWKVIDSHVGQVETNAITLTGNVDVTFRGSIFEMVHKNGFMVNVSGNIRFEENLIERLEPDGLKNLLCGAKNISMDKNTVHMESPHDQPYNSSTTPFHSSCGKVQVFVVMSPPQPQTLQKTSNATWILLTVILLIVTVIAVAGYFVYRNRVYLREYRRGETAYTIGLERTTMQELHNNDTEEEEVEEDEDTGMSNPVYGIKEPS